nr:single Ig IL-1-related receptor [Manis javanica]
MAGVCDRAPTFLSPSGNQVLGPALGSVVALNCTAWVVSGPHCPLPSVQWLKDGQLLANGSHYNHHEDSWVKANLSEVFVSSIMEVNLTSAENFGAFTCSVQNVSSFSFTLWRAGPAGHVAAVLASLLVLLALLLAALLYVKCRLNVLLWYQDVYGDVEMNGWGDPAAPPLTVPPRREGLCRLLELTRRPIFITFEGQRRDSVHPALRLLRQHRHLVTLLLWRPGSVTPSSDFWKELQLALPRKMQYRAMEGDPQTRLQDDKDPMLIVRGHAPEGRALDPELDPDPEGDLGVRGPIFGEPSAPPHASGVSLGGGRGSEVDISDLGSRNYGARTDFYCLVSEDDV